jgi:hypothetical protein
MGALLLSSTLVVYATDSVTPSMISNNVTVNVTIEPSNKEASSFGKKSYAVSIKETIASYPHVLDAVDIVATDGDEV